MMKQVWKKYSNSFIYIAVTAIIFTITEILSNKYNLVAGATMIMYGMGGYFYIVYRVSNRNWMDIRALFHAAWVITIGLSVLRLAEYQQPWEKKTWVLLAATYILFQIGVHNGIAAAPKFARKVQKIGTKLFRGKITYQFKKDRIFTICVATTLIGILCFSANVYIKGFIPCFSTDVNAYMNFYTRFHIFSVAATAVSGLCFYCINTQKLHWAKKLILWGCIIYHVILFPVLVVSRGVFMIAALCLITMVFYCYKKKLWVLILSVAVVMGLYLGMSALRGYTQAQMEVFFEPTEIVIDKDEEIPDKPEISNPIEESDDLQSAEISENISVIAPSEENEVVTFKLPPRLAFLYSYLTVSHDNFNLAVKNTVGYTWGALQLKPIQSVLQIPFIEQLTAKGEWYQVNPYLNTVNFVGEFYYDFHEWGVVLLTLFWASIFGLIQGYHEKTKGCFSRLILGNVMTPVILSFFASWMGNFTLWLYWGVAFLLFLFCGITRKKEDPTSSQQETADEE